MATPTEQEALACYVMHCAQISRALPLPTARLFLRGALMIGADHESIEPLRRAYYDLVGAEVTLEPIASGQLQLSLTPPPVVGDLRGVNGSTL